MTQHTQEPWRLIHDDLLLPEIIAGEKVVIPALRPNADADMRRIVACVNACARWETKDLIERADGISMTLRELFDGQRDVIIELRQQRDELLDALETVQTLIHGGMDGTDDAIYKCVSKAIAKAGG